MVHPLKEIISLQKKNIPIGITSICSANEIVLEAAMGRAMALNTYVLIEATANQVNQNGGYTGMRPKEFREFVYSIADQIGFNREKIILGGDHLGPLTWSNMEEEWAMLKAEELIVSYVKAGFTKIHIDTSMRLASDAKDEPLLPQTIAIRGARLAKIAEETFLSCCQSNAQMIPPVYVIGSEVPIPGGAQEEEKVQVTRVEDFHETVDLFKAAFEALGIKDAWERVIAVVVQPGVEFGDDSIEEYCREEAKALTQAIKTNENLVFEGHSTDYQTPQKLKEMVEDGIAILKVGPALTFALREALFALEKIEVELIDSKELQPSNLGELLEKAMLDNPENWRKHYHGDERKLRISRKYSFSDRARYYIGDSAVDEAIVRLITNLRVSGIPLFLLSQYAPVQYNKVRKKMIPNDPYSIVMDAVVHVLDEYYYAVFPDTLNTIKNYFA